MSDRTGLADALAYFRPHPTANGPVILTPSKMREHLAVIEAALNPFDGFTPDVERIALLMGKVWLDVKGRDGKQIEDADEFLFAAPDDYAACCAVAKAILAALRQSQSPDRDAGEGTLDERLKAAGMYTVPEMMGVTPLTRWQVPVGMVGDLEFFGKWLDRRAAEYLRMRASRDLAGKDEADELHEWVLAHSAAFSEIRTNFKAATGTLPLSPEGKPSC